MPGTVDEAREALDTATGQVAGHPYLQGTERVLIMDAADAYGTARELRGHVEACGIGWSRGPVFHKCGDGWYCDRGAQLDQ